MPNPIPRRSILAAITLLPIAPVPLGAVDPDAPLLAMTAEYQTAMEADAETSVLVEMLKRIEMYEPTTIAGVVAKLRIAYPDDIVRLGLRYDEAPIDRIGYAGIADLYRLLGVAT